MPHHIPILVVDDDKADIFLLRRAFEKAGAGQKLLTLSDGQEAIDYLSGAAEFQDRGRYPVPRLLLLDLKMPRLDGFDVLQWLDSREELAALPVIVLSSSGEDSDLKRAKELGADDYVIKPTDPEELIRIVQNLLARWLAKPC